MYVCRNKTYFMQYIPQSNCLNVFAYFVAVNALHRADTPWDWGTWS